DRGAGAVQRGPGRDEPQPLALLPDPLRPPADGDRGGAPRYPTVADPSGPPDRPDEGRRREGADPGAVGRPQGGRAPGPGGRRPGGAAGARGRRAQGHRLVPRVDGLQREHPRPSPALAAGARKELAVIADLFALMWAPFLMCLVLTGIHAYL